jgi:hypothetical protein
MVSCMHRVWLVVMACVCTGACRLSIHGELIDCGVGAKTGIGANMDLFSMIALGASHACATRYRTGRVFCWSNTANTTISEASVAPNYIHDAHSLSLGENHSCALWGHHNTLTCWGGDIGISSPVNVSHNVRMVGVGHPHSNHVCFLMVSKMMVSCVGSNSVGQLGLGSAGSDILTVAAERRARY